MHRFLCLSLARRAALQRPAALRCRSLATAPTPPTPPASDRPDEATVRRLAAEAKWQQKAWEVVVPEQGIKFGDRKFWILLTFVGVLHAINTYRDSRKLVEPDLPPGALRRLPGGKLLMEDGSTAKEEQETGHAHTLHKYKETGEGELVLDRAWRLVKDSV
tara:strand:+ start:931 stop:1413 length:483 start_codon:yes stop_codon:yes gene_type:complete